MGMNDLNFSSDMKIHEFPNQKSNILVEYLNLLLTWNFLCLYIDYNQLFSKIQSYILFKVHQDTDNLKKWNKAILKMKENVEIEFDHILPVFEGGFRPVSMESNYIKDFEDQIMELKPMEMSEDFEVADKDGFVDVEHLVNEIKDEVKKGNRLSFKLMQELQSTIEELSSSSSEEEKKLTGDAIKEYKKKADHFMKIAIQAIDSMDLIHQSVLKTDLKEWAIQIESVIQNFLQIMDSFGIEQLNVQDEFFDGETMISIGTVSPDYAPHLEKYQVYSVIERGFRLKESGKLIREAKVITIY